MNEKLETVLQDLNSKEDACKFASQAIDDAVKATLTMLRYASIVRTAIEDDDYEPSLHVFDMERAHDRYLYCRNYIDCILENLVSVKQSQELITSHPLCILSNFLKTIRTALDDADKAMQDTWKTWQTRDDRKMCFGYFAMLKDLYKETMTRYQSGDLNEGDVTAQIRKCLERIFCPERVDLPDDLEELCKRLENWIDLFCETFEYGVNYYKYRYQLFQACMAVSGLSSDKIEAIYKKRSR